jgi:hypothetical protein
MMANTFEAVSGVGSPVLTAALNVLDLQTSDPDGTVNVLAGTNAGTINLLVGAGGQANADCPFQAQGFKSSDGSAGVTDELEVELSGAATAILVIKYGLITEIQV